MHSRAGLPVGGYLHRSSDPHYTLRCKVDPMSSTTFEPVFRVGAPVTRLKRLTRGLRAWAGHSGPAGPLCPAHAEKIGWCPAPPLSVIQIGRATIVERLMRSLGVVEPEIAIQPLARLAWAAVVRKIDFLILHTAPQALGEDVIQCATLPIHANPCSRC